MKKRIFFVIGLSVMLMAGGCAKKSPADDVKSNVTPTKGVESTEASPSAAPVKGDINVDEYIKLGKYKGIEVTVENYAVTDADVEAAVQSDLESKATTEEITDRKVVQDGDIVNIDYEGSKDGKTFDGGTAADQDLAIGSKQFIEGFEEGLIGKSVGDKVELNLTFPKDYQEASIAGQAVLFKVTINSIKKSVIPELTEDFVKNNTDYKTIDDYKKAMRENLEASNKDSMENYKKTNVLSAVMEGSEISSVPQSLLDYYSSRLQGYYEYQASMSNMTMDQFLKAGQTSKEEFDTYVKNLAESQAKAELVEKAVAKAEGIKVTDEELTKSIADFMQKYNVPSEEELFKQVPKNNFKDELLLNKALDFLVKNAVIQVVDVTPSPAPTAAAK